MVKLTHSERSSYAPLTVAVIANLLFFAGYAWFGQSGWGERAINEQAVGEISRWCERVQPGLFHEPINALSNLGFIAAGLWMFWLLGKDTRTGRTGLMYGNNPIALLYAAATVWLGPGSLLMHGTHTGWGAWADNLSMVMYILIPWLINVSSMGRWSNTQTLIVYISLVTIYGLGRAAFGSGLGINLDFFGLSIAFWIISEVLFRFWSQWLRIASGFVGFLVAGIFGITPFDMLAAPEQFWWIALFWLPGLLASEPPPATRKYFPWFLLGVVSYFSAFTIWQTGKPDHSLCNPDSLIQAHGIWHLLSALATLSFFIFLRTEKFERTN